MFETSKRIKDSKRLDASMNLKDANRLKWLKSLSATALRNVDFFMHVLSGVMTIFLSLQFTFYHPKFSFCHSSLLVTQACFLSLKFTFYHSSRTINCK